MDYLFYLYIIIVVLVAVFIYALVKVIRGAKYKKVADKYLEEYSKEVKKKVKNIEDKFSTYKADFSCGTYATGLLDKYVDVYSKKKLENVFPNQTHRIVIDYNLNKLLYSEFKPVFFVNVKKNWEINKSLEVNFVEENLKDLVKYELVIKEGKAEGFSTSVSGASFSNNSALGGSIGNSTMHQTINGISVLMIFKDKKEIDMPFVTVKGVYLDSESVQDRLKDARSLCNVLETYMEENKKASSMNSTIKDEPVVGKKEKLKELKELLDDGLISQAEFDKEKAKILNN